MEWNLGQTITRFDDWPERLDAYLNRPHRFEWHRNNCALFAANAVFVMTGRDLGAPYRGPKTEKGIKARLRAVAGGVEQAATKALGEPIEVNRAGRGDVVLINAEGGASLAVHVGNAIAALRSDYGIELLPVSEAIKAWKV